MNSWSCIFSIASVACESSSNCTKPMSVLGLMLIERTRPNSEKVLRTSESVAGGVGKEGKAMAWSVSVDRR